MSFRIPALCALFLTTAALSGCGTSHDVVDRADVTVAGDANGTTVSLAVGQTLALELRDLGDGGYLPWVLATPPNAAVLALTDSAHVPPTSGRMGDYGIDRFVFRAASAGHTQLVATATQPWVGGDTATFTLNVDVVAH